MKDIILKIENFSKQFRSQWTFRPVQAVKNLDLEVYRGESFGFLGHNGAGKTTTIKSLMGLIGKTTGKIYLNGEELVNGEQHRLIGYLPEQPYFYDHLTVFETLEFFAKLHGIGSSQRNDKIKRVLERVGLSRRQKSPVRSLSKGLQQRLGMAQAIINDPHLLILDEPFSGLDPIGRLEIRHLILELNKQGTTVFMSSHILSDVEDICNRVSIMSNGELKAVFDIEQTPSLFGQSFNIILRGAEGHLDFIAKLHTLCNEVETLEIVNETQTRCKVSEYATAQAILGEAVARGIQIQEFKSCAPSLEEIFMSITGNYTKIAEATENKLSEKFL